MYCVIGSLVLYSFGFSDNLLQAILDIAETISKRSLCPLVDNLPIEHDIKPLGEGGVGQTRLVVHEVSHNGVTVLRRLGVLDDLTGSDSLLHVLMFWDFYIPREVGLLDGVSLLDVNSHKVNGARELRGHPSEVLEDRKEGGSGR